MTPRDQATRDRFAGELDHDFSVIAPAGVGKTTAIVNHVIAIASQQPESLPKLVVVTYTNRAADEMQQRARVAILKAGVDEATQAAFNRAFFGTIHSFCLRLLERHGQHLGLPARMELVKDEEALWLEFVRQLPDVAGVAAEDARRLFRHVSMLDVIEMGRYLQPERVPKLPDKAWPRVDLTSVLALPATGTGKKNILRGQEMLRAWEAACASGAEFAPVPVSDKGGAKFVEAWNNALAPLREWLGAKALMVAREVAVRYRENRLAQGLVTYDDQIALAAQLMRHEETGKAIRAENYRVILDEAQDADPLQFEVLRSVGAGGFSMVGDPQQSIYGSRANLPQYLGVHRQMDDLKFAVTFRCDEAIVDTVNALGPAMLNNLAGQVKFEELEARPGATTGQVVRWEPKTDGLKEGWNAALRAACEAQQLAKWLKDAGLKKLRARGWEEVAVLCPLKRWFGSLRRELTAAGFDVQVQSHRDVNGDSPAYAWLTALLVVVTEPRNSFEIVGVLREVFGISDQALADFCESKGERFQIEDEVAGKGEVPEALTLLGRARQEMLRSPVRDAVRRLVEVTFLRERLAALPDDEGRDLPGELDDLLVRAAVAEAGGLSLSEWTAELRHGFEDVRESEAARPGAIQLITCQKAKGLEWDAVVVPFFFRAIQSHRREYPVVIERDGVPARAAFAKADLSAEDQDALKTRRRQEMQRVLYVAMTRARRTLVMAGDEGLFDKQGNSFADLLAVRDAGTNREKWLGIGAHLGAESSVPGRKAAADAGMAELPAMDVTQRKRALANAASFVHRTLPHELAARWTEEETEQRREPDPEFAGTGPRDRGMRYGVWWHDMMQAMNWNAGPDAWRRTFRAKVTGAPDVERAEEEWARFEKSELATRLRDETLVVQAEMSFLAGKVGECVEGFIDLAVLDEKANRWEIIDWKTDRVADKLVETYGPQLRAYAAALKQVTGLGARAAIYSSVTGQLLPVH